MPKFSVIIPVYNAAATLPQTLESVAKQSLADFEVVLVDDGSTDNSAEIVISETKGWENGQVISQENMGLGNARNVAAKAARADWLVFLDADDYWAADKLSVLNDAIRQNPNAELFYHPIFEKYPNGNMRKRAFWEVSNLADFVEKGNPFVPSAVAIKRDVFFKAGGFAEDRNQVEDLLLWFKLLAGGINVHAMNRPLTVYQVGVGVTGNLMEHLEKVKKALSSAREAGFISEAHEATFLQRKNYEVARQLHKLGDFAKAGEFYALLPELSLKKRLLKALCKLKISF